MTSVRAKTRRPQEPMTTSLSTSAAVLSSDDQHRLYKNSLTVVVVSQVFGGAGLAAGVTVGALLAQDMLGGEGVAGLPAALFTLGSALAAFTVGRVSQRSGRRLGIAGGFIVGALGAAGIVLAAVLDNPIMFFTALFVYGSGTATNLQARYAGTDLAHPSPAAPRSRSPWCRPPSAPSSAPTRSTHSAMLPRH